MTKVIFTPLVHAHVGRTRMHRNAAASLFHMDNLTAASGDAGR